MDDPAAAQLSALAALCSQLKALACPAFSCEASRRPGAPRAPGRQAVAAVLEVVRLAGAVLHAAAGLLQTLEPRACHSLVFASVCACRAAHAFLRQQLPAGGVRLLSCADEGAVRPVVQALLSLLCAQVGVQAASRPSMAGSAWQGERTRLAIHARQSPQ